MNDVAYMSKALALAKQGCGWVNPNPMVGSIIVKHDVVIGRGYHMRYGDLHAERNALASCQTSAKGATLYVTMEPCCHHGKTPPCVNAIIENGISRVVIGCLDPNAKVAGNGVAILKEHNIQVDIGVLEEECTRLIKPFAKFITKQIPYVTMKYAMTMDGKIATYTNQSKWITGEKARLHVQTTRHANSAIMVGVNTILSDDPLLTCRLKHSKNPIRIVCDTNLRTPFHANIIKTANDVRTILATCVSSPLKHEPFKDNGCEIVVVEKTNGQLNLHALMKQLGTLGIDSLLLEGGGTLNWSALQHRIVDCIQTYIAPKLFGGTSALTPIEGQGVESPTNAYTLKPSNIEKIGDDYLIESEVRYPCSQES